MDQAAQMSVEVINESIETTIETTVDAIAHPWVFFDVDYGYSVLKVYRDDEVDKFGSFFSIRGNVFLDFDRFTLEGGGGYFYTSMKGNPKGNITSESAIVGSLLTEGGALWIFTPEWRLGGKARWIFGTETDFGPVEEAKKNNLLVSVDGFYQPASLDNIRIGAHYQYDITIPKRDFNAFLLSVGAGFQINKKPPEKKVVQKKPAPVDEGLPPIPQVKGKIRFEVAAADGIPLKDVTYKITNASGEVASGTTANSSGEVQDLLPGTYSTHVGAEGYEPKEINVVLGSGGVSRVRVMLITKTELELRGVIETGIILFEVKKSVISPESYPILDKVVEIMRYNKSIQVLGIEGHTDSVGQRLTNIKLSRDRAEAVKTYLVSKGVAAERLEFEGYGPDRPIASNKTKEGKTKNRRVEFVLKAVKAEPAN